MSYTYFVILYDGEGAVSAEKLTKAQLDERLSNYYYGSGEHAPQWESAADFVDKGCVGGGLALHTAKGALIIKGDIVQPYVVETIVKVALP